MTSCEDYLQLHGTEYLTQSLNTYERKMFCTWGMGKRMILGRYNLRTPYKSSNC
jgi:hypothetical protein